MHHKVLELIPMTTYRVSRFELHFVVISGLDGKNESARKNVFVRRLVFLGMTFKVPRFRRLDISFFFASVISLLLALGSNGSMISVR